MGKQNQLRLQNISPLLDVISTSLGLAMNLVLINIAWTQRHKLESISVLAMELSEFSRLDNIKV